MTAAVSGFEVVIAVHEVVPADFQEAPEHISRIPDDPDIGVADILADPDRQDSDPEVHFPDEKEEFGVESEALDRERSKKRQDLFPLEELEAALGVGKIEIAEDEDLEDVKSAGSEDSVERRGFFEDGSGREPGSDDHVRSVDRFHEAIKLRYRDRQVGIDHENEFGAGREHPGADGSTLAPVLRERDMNDRNIRVLASEAFDFLRRPVRAAVRDDDNLVFGETGSDEFMHREDIGGDHAPLFVTGDNDRK